MIEIGSIRDAVREPLDRLGAAETDREGRESGRAILARIDDPIDQDWLLRELKDRSERYLGIDPHRSLRISSVLIDLAGLAGRPEHQAFGCLARADALRSLARYDESRALFLEAGEAFLAQGNPVGWARTRTGLLLVSQFLGRAAEALVDVDPARAILIGHGQWLRAAGLSQNAGLAEADLGRYDEALARFDDALAMYQRAAEVGQLGTAAAEIRSAKSRANQALVLTRLGDFRAALSLLETARSTFARHGETVLVYSQDTSIGDVHAALGNYGRALQLYSQSFAGFGDVGLAIDAAFVALKRVECYLRLNLDEVAVELSQEAVSRFRQVGSPTELAKALAYRALALTRLGQAGEALILLDQAVRTFEGIGVLGHLGLSLLQRADLKLGENDRLGAEADAIRARAILLDRGMVVPAARAGLTLAAGWLRVGRYGEAGAVTSESLAVAEERDLAWLAQEAHHLRGRLALAQGDGRAALAAFQASISNIERVQGGLANELQIHFLGDKLAVYHDIIELSLRHGQIANAFGYLERAKSRALVDYLARHPDVRFRTAGAANPALDERLARLREEHHWFYNHLHRNDEVAPGQMWSAIDSKEWPNLQHEIHQREKEIGEILERQALERYLPTEGSGSARCDHDYLRPPAVPAGTVLLEFYCTGDQIGVFVAWGGRLTFVRLTDRPAEPRRLLNAWSLNLSATARAIAAGAALNGLAQNAEKILAALGQILLGPIEPHLTGCERLIVIPHGLTHSVPWSALKVGQRHLVDFLEVSVAPSASVLRFSASRPARDRTRALVVGHSDGGRLPGAITEAEAIASILPGRCYLEDDATRTAFLREAPGYGIIHLAAHAESRLDNPTFAHLKLADGLLGPVDVFNLDLAGALVTLSGCETGQALVAGGDELVGLSRGFLYAGVATLVQSLWKVEDRATARLMGVFYHALAAGRPAGSALRAAQLILRAERGEHPVFWASFQVVGDPGYLTNIPPPLVP